jgi:hypothetical protein
MKQIILAVACVVACKSSSSTTSQPSTTEPPQPAPVQPAPAQPPPEPTSGSTQTQEPMPPPEPDKPPTRPDPRPSAPPKLGEKCGSGDSCGTGLSCVSYYGIAGAAGPQFKTCEVKCADSKATCPSGTKCVTIADGPGKVCRAGMGGTTPPPAAAKPKMGENCGAGDACGDGLTCVSYYGIAGARGPQFKTCETKCGKGGGACPSGTKCVTIADGPGQVCRP